MAERQTGCNRVTDAIRLANQLASSGSTKAKPDVNKIDPRYVFCAFESTCSLSSIQDGTTPDLPCPATEMELGPLPPSNRTERFMGQLTNHQIIFDSQNGTPPQTQ